MLRWDGGMAGWRLRLEQERLEILIGLINSFLPEQFAGATSETIGLIEDCLPDFLYQITLIYLSTFDLKC